MKATVAVCGVIVLGFVLVLSECSWRDTDVIEIDRECQLMSKLSGIGTDFRLHAKRVNDVALAKYRVNSKTDSPWNIRMLFNNLPIEDHFDIEEEANYNSKYVVWFCYAYERESMERRVPMRFCEEETLPFIFVSHKTSEGKILLDLVCLTDGAVDRIANDPIGKAMEISASEDGGYSIRVSKWPYYTSNLPDRCTFFIQKTDFIIPGRDGATNWKD